MLGGNERKLLERNAALLKAVERQIAAKEAEVANPVRRDIDADDDIQKSSTASARAKMGVATVNRDDRAGILLSEVIDVPEARAEQEAGFLRYVVSKTDAKEIGTAPFSVLFLFCNEDGTSCPAPSLYDSDAAKPVWVSGAWGSFGGRKLVPTLWSDFEAFEDTAPVFEPFAALGGGIQRFESFGAFECWALEAIDSMTFVKDNVPYMKVAEKTDDFIHRLVDWFKVNRTRAQAALSPAIMSILALARTSFDAVFQDNVEIILPNNDDWPDWAVVFMANLFNSEVAFYGGKQHRVPVGKRYVHRMPTIEKVSTGDAQISLFEDADLSDGVGA